MSTGFIAELGKSRNNVPAFGWMALIALISFVYYHFVHKSDGRREESGFHKVVKKYVMPITILVVLGTIVLSAAMPAPAPVANTSVTINYSTETTGEPGSIG